MASGNFDASIPTQMRHYLQVQPSGAPALRHYPLLSRDTHDKNPSKTESKFYSAAPRPKNQPSENGELPEISKKHGNSRSREERSEAAKKGWSTRRSKDAYK